MKAISILFGQIQYQNGQSHGITLNTAWVLSSVKRESLVFDRLRPTFEGWKERWCLTRGSMIA